MILVDRGCQPVCTKEDHLQGFVADEFGNPHLVRMRILIVSEIGSGLYPLKVTTRKEIAPILYIKKSGDEGWR